MDEAIKITNLSFTYPDGHAGLDGINLVVHSGENVAIIGPNGAGKSTLLLHLNGILHSDGAVQICGLPMLEKNIKVIRQRVGVVFQDPEDQLFSLNVFDDVAFGPINMGYTDIEVRRRVDRALKWVSMIGYKERSSHHLSLGEKKRIAIATVLSMDPEILVLDEPSSNLDPRSKWSLLDLLKGLPITKVIATHDLDLVLILCPRTVILDEGKVVADGNTEDIMRDINLLRKHGLAPDAH